MGWKRCILILTIIMLASNPLATGTEDPKIQDKAHDALDSGIIYLKESMNEEGYWRCAIPSTPGNTAANLLILKECGESESSPRIIGAVKWLQKSQRDDGGWAMTINQEDSSNIDITYLVLASLEQANLSANSSTIWKAKDFINKHGGWDKLSWSTRTLLARHNRTLLESAKLPVPLEIMLDPVLFNQTVSYYHQFYYVPVALMPEWGSLSLLPSVLGIRPCI
jgi:squalene cyclase